ncbi:MAG: c-type cytochrome [Opitutus sp.]
MSQRSCLRFAFSACASLATIALVHAADSDAAKGQKVFTACAPCHAADQPARTGPDLRGVTGRNAGTLPGFRYSRAMKNSKAIWNDQTLDAYLADPQSAMPGNTMPYPGLPDEAARRDLIAYLKTLQ